MNLLAHTQSFCHIWLQVAWSDEADDRPYAPKIITQIKTIDEREREREREGDGEGGRGRGRDGGARDRGTGGVEGEGEEEEEIVRSAGWGDRMGASVPPCTPLP